MRNVVNTGKKQLVPAAVKGGNQQLGFGEGFYFIVYVQFAVDILYMLLHRMQTDVQTTGHLPGSIAFGDPV